MAIHEALVVSTCPESTKDGGAGSGTLSVLDMTTGGALATFKPCAAPACGTAVVSTGALFALQNARPLLHCWPSQKVGA
jgi:hypothetical protein